MRLSYVTTCVNYLDYLRVAHHHNLSAAAFDDYIIVTTTEDKETLNWTQGHKEVMPVYTDAFYRHGARFNKGLALTEGFNALRSICNPEWVAVMDADTFVLPSWREDIKNANLDKEYMYGARRVLLPTFAEYERLWTDDLDTFKCPEGFGFGWLQLFHWQSKAFQAQQDYPTGNDCTEVDWKFRNRWGDFEVPYTVPRGNLRELPFRVFNLGKDGENHFGRVSAPFVPPTV